MSKIKDIDLYNRPREKALTNGIKSLDDRELLALIIRCGVKDLSALDIADFLLLEYKSLSNLLSADIHGLMKIKGIKKAKAIEFIAVLELAKRANYENNSKVMSIKESKDIYDLFKVDLENEKQEHFIVIFLNIKLTIIKKETLFIGGECSSIVDVNLLFKKAIECGARRIICVHNHPSGDPTPSKEDILITERIRSICEIVKVQLIDHIIIGKNKYFSFEQMGI